MSKLQICYNGGNCHCVICGKISEEWELISDCCPDCDSNQIKCDKNAN